MIQVLNRAFDILDYLAEEPETVRTLSNIVARVKLHPATCANIIRTLVSRTYVEQTGHRKGYVLGPMAYYLARRGPYRKSLIEIAQPHITALADTVREHVLLAVIRGNKRFVLCEAEGNPTVRINEELRLGADIYGTATGRLLLAYLPAPQLAVSLSTQGSPGKFWPEAATEKNMRRRLDEIRRAGFVVHQSCSDLTGIAFPVREQGEVTAALGLFLLAHRFKGQSFRDR